MRDRPLLLAFASCCLMLGCGGSPSQPTPSGSSLPLQKGPQLLELTGFDVSSDPEYPPCSNVGSPRQGKHIVTSVSLELSGSDWIARSIAPDNSGTLELRFHDAGSFSMGGQNVSGTIQGSAGDISYGSHSQFDVRFAIAGSAQVSGRVTGGSLTMGRFSGVFSFGDSNGSGGTCSAVSFLLQPNQGLY